MPHLKKKKFSFFLIAKNGGDGGGGGGGGYCIRSWQRQSVRIVAQWTSAAEIPTTDQQGMYGGGGREGMQEV